MDIGGITIDDDQARQFGLVAIGLVAAVCVLALGRRARRVILGMVVTAAIVACLVFAFRAGAISDPWGILAS